MKRHVIGVCVGLSLVTCSRMGDPTAANLQSSEQQALQASVLDSLELDGGVEPGSVRVAAEGDQFWVTYLKGSDLYVAKFGDTGSLIQSPTSQLTASPNEYAIAASADAGLALIRSNSDHVQLDVVDLAGSGSTSLRDPNSAVTTWPALATDGQRFLGVWVSGQDSEAAAGSAVVMQFIGADATPQGSASVLSFGGESYAKPSVASAGSGRPYLVAWESTDGGPSRDGIESVLVYPDAGHGGLLRLSASANESQFPSVASNGSEFLVAWADETSATQLYINTVGFDGSIGFDGGRAPKAAGQEINRCVTPFVTYDGTTYLLGCVSIDDGGIRLYSVEGDGGATELPTTSGADARNAGVGPSFRLAASTCNTALLAFEGAQDAGVDASAKIEVGLRLLTDLPDAGACSTFPTIGGSSSGSGSGATGASGTTTSSPSSSTTGTSGGASSGSTSAGSTGSGSATSGAATSGTTGSSGGSATSGSEATGNADVFGCSSGGMGFAPLALLGLLALRRRRGAGLLMLVAALGTLGFSMPAHAASKTARAKVAVLTIEAKLGVSPDLAELLTTRLVARIQDVTGQAVISSEDIKHALGLERTKQLLGCSESSCMAELGGALGVDYLVTGTIAKIGNARTFDAQIMNTAKAVVLHRYSHRLPPDADDSAFLDEVAPAVAALFPDAQLPNESTTAPASVASAAPVEVQQPTATAGEGKFLIDLLATSELTEKGGYARLRVGYWVIPSLAVVVGGLATVSAKPGVQGGLELQPFAITPGLKPFISAAGQAIFRDGTSAGITGSIGVAWSPVDHLVLRAEVPVTYFFSVPNADLTHKFYAFAGLGVGVRL